MSETLLLGLVLQAGSVALLFLALGRSVLRRVGPYFIFSALVYHGLTEIVQVVTGQSSKYRGFSTPGGIDTWTVVVGAAMLIFSLTYVLVVRAQEDQPVLGAPEVPVEVDIARVVRTLDWRVLTLVSLPLIAVIGTEAFRIGDQTGLSPVESSAQAGLAHQFLTLVLVLATISYVLSHQGRVVLPLLVQLAVMGLVGSRLDVFVAAATTLFGLAFLRRTPSVRQVFTVLAVVGTLALAITGARNDVGRPNFAAAGLGERIPLLFTGAINTLAGVEPTYAGQTQPLGERLDGNSFAAAVLDALDGGRDPVGLTTAVNSLSLAVPSFLNPEKLTTDLELRSEKVYLNAHLGIGIPGDFLPTQLGSLLGWFGPIGLMVLAGILGLAIGIAERFLRSKLTPSRLILTLTLFLCVMSYPTSTETWPIEFRGAFLAVAVVFLIERSRRYQRPGRPTTGWRRRWRPQTSATPTGSIKEPVNCGDDQPAGVCGPTMAAPRR